MASRKVTLSIPDELKQRLDMYEQGNPYKPINLSAILQAGLDEILRKEGY